jgi:hypothetical protein
MNSGLVVYDQSIDCCLASFFRLPRFSLLFARSAAAHDTDGSTVSARRRVFREALLLCSPTGRYIHMYSAAPAD